MKKLYSLIILFISSITFLSAQLATINITTSGGSYASEKWVSITDGIDGTGNQIWGQANSTPGVYAGSGLINQDIQIAAGTYYVNCYDTYGDGWDGTSISVTSYGAVLASGSPGNNAGNLEASYQIVVVAPPSCLMPNGLNASNTTSSSADISWTAGGTENSWNFDYGPTGYTQGQGSSTIAANPNSLFIGGANATWSYIHPLVITSDGPASQAAQTYTINVTSLPASGAKARLIKSTANGGAAFTPGTTGQALVLGANTFTAAAVSFNRYVKIQFNNDQFEFDSIAVNGTSVYTSGSSVSTTSTSLSGLNAGTSYDAYVQADCGSGDVSGWVGPFSFTTNTSPLSIPTCEDFESGLPGPSTALNAAVNASATVIAGAAANSSAYGVQLTGPDAFVSGAWSGGSTSTTEAQAWGTNVTTHSNVAFNVDATAESVVILSFDLRQTYTFGTKYSWFRVTVNGTQIGASINPISNTDPFLNYSYDLSAYAGTSFDLKLEHAGKYSPAYNANYAGDQAMIDNICISAPNCLTPTALTASAITATTASASWNGTGATSSNIEYGPNGYTQGSGTTAVPNSVTIADNPNSLFVGGANATWSYIHPLVITSDGAASQAAQTYTINVTSLPASGAKARLIKSTANGGAAFTPGATGQALVLGANTFTAAAVSFNRYVKIQFNNDQFEFDAISINGISVYSSSNTSLTGLTPQTQYDIYVQSDCGSGGISSWAGPLTFTTACAAASAPAIEDFDAGFPFCWTQSTADDFNWILDASGTPSGSTGPSDDITGGGNYMFIETSGGTDGNQAVLFSQAIDLSSLSVPQLRFYSHMYGATINTLNVDISADAGVTFTQVFTKTGDQGNQWNEELVDLSNYSGTVLFKITASQGTSFTGDIAIDDFEIRETPACPAPTALTASAITSTTANVSWTAGGTETAWNFEYGLSPFPSPAAPSSISATTFSATGLSPQTTYDFYVRADCGSDQSIWVGPITFTTACAAASAPAIEDFDAGFPVCWSQSTTDDFNWTLDASGTPSSSTGPSDDITGGGNYMFIETSGGTDGNQAVLFSQAIDLSALTVPQLVFQSHMFGATINTLSVDISADAGVTFTQLFTKTGDQGNQWNEELVDLSNYSGTVLFRITASQGTSFTGDIAIDDFEIRETPSCSSPTSLVASNLATNSADLSWTPGGTESAWNFEYGPVGFTQGSGTSLPLTSANTSLTGLTTDTQYDAYVQADCGRGNTSTWIGPYTFSTLPNPSCIYTMNMIDSYGDGWNGASIDVSINGAFVASFSNPSSAGGGQIYTDTISAYTGDNVSFSWTSGSYDGEVSFEILDPNFNSLTAGYISAPIAGFFLADANSPSVCAPPACQDPVLLTASNLTSTSANISWTAGGTETAWNFEYGSVGFTQGTGTLSALTSPNTSLAGLTAQTQYDVYVQADCGSGLTSGWAGPYTFTTLCDLLTTFPYTMDFENGFGCWSVVDVDGGNSWNTFTGLGLNASIAAGIQYNFSTHDDHLISPKFSVTSNSSRFSFNASDYSGYPESFDVLVSTTGKAAADFTDTISSEVASGGYSYYQYNLSSYIGQDVYVSIHSTSTNQYYLFVDDVTIDAYNSVNTTQSEFVCNSYTWAADGNTYTSSGTYIYVSSPANNLAGVDSSATLNLTVGNYSLTDTVVICDSYTWSNGTTYNYSTTLPSQTLTTASGCDSIIYLDLTIIQGDSVTDTQTACGSYTWNGVSLIYTGIYFDTLQNNFGCDSAVILDLTINNSTVGNEYITACDSYIWNNVTYDSTGNYSYDNSGLLKNNVGCDSTSNLTLTINYSSSSNTAVTECDSYTWGLNGTTYDTDGTYINSDTTSDGCPQIDTLVLTINPEYNDTISVTACDTYTWLANGNTYTSSTTSDSLYQSINGCDSLVTLNLTIINSTVGNENITACDSATWNGTTYTTSGNYSYNNLGLLKNNVGCDSTSNLTLTVYSSSSSDTAVTECGSYNWVVNGSTFNYNSSGTYINSSLTPVGCPQIDTLVLTINPEYNDTISVTACDTFAWDGVNYTISDTITRTYTLSTGCDSLVTYDLTINNSTVGNENITACDSATWNGITYTTGGNYSLVGLNNNVNCDSTSNVNLTINYSSSSNTADTSCGSYNWVVNGSTFNYNSSGTYINSSLTPVGNCPQIDTLVLIINPEYNDTITLTICDSFAWDGNVYYTSDTITKPYTLSTGCDSLVTYDLTINNSTVGNENITACDSATWNGTTYTTDGNYSYNNSGLLKNNVGCDSTSNLTLTVNSSSSSNTADTSCGSYNWVVNGSTFNYNSSGTYINSSLTPVGNCPQIDTLVLIINPEYNDTITLTTCDSFAWDGIKYYTSDTITKAYTLSTGCDSLVTYDLTITESTVGNENITACDSATWNGTKYITSGSYSYDNSGLLKNNVACDSTSNVNLTINYSSSSKLTTAGCISYPWNGQNYNSSGLYTYTDTNALGCPKYDSLDLTITLTASSLTTVSCDSFPWNDTIYTTTGTYYSSSACVDTLFLTINSSTSTSSNLTICDSLTWIDGITYSASGTYNTTTTNNAGCLQYDSLDLTITNSTVGNENITACDSATWNGTKYYTSGNYSLGGLNNNVACDSTSNVNLTINYSSSSNTAVTECGSYNWAVSGSTFNYTSSGVYTYTDINNLGCPQYDTLVLTINPEYNDTISLTKCDTFAWDGLNYTISDTITKAYTLSTGCDSLVTYDLTIINSTVGNENITACDSATWNGTTYTSSGNYSYTTPGSNTCDSTVNLTLTVNSSSSSNTAVTECGSYNWVVNGSTFNYDSSGTYVDTNTNGAGCPQYDTLLLTINPEYNDTISLTTCDTFAWDGVNYTISDTITRTYTLSTGCDSLVTYDLTIINSTVGNENITACDSATWNGTTYTSSGNYSYTTPGSNTCDSTVNLTLTVNSSSSSNTAVTECGSYNWVVSGSTFNYDSSGTYVDTNTNGAGCPQYDTLVLTINPEYNDTISLTTCDTFAWDGLNYTISDTITKAYTLSTGCDSLVTYDLTIINSTVGNENITACDSATWNGTKYYTSGSYSLGGLNNNVGCDSTSNVNLTINSSSSSLLTTTSCNSYFWKGSFIDSSGIYTAVGTNLFGCDQVDSLDLTISNLVTSNDIVTACDSYSWNGVTYNQSGTYSQTGLTSSTGCDSTANLNLTINNSVNNPENVNSCDSYSWNGTTYTTSGVYTGAFQTNSGCDSTVILNLTITKATGTDTQSACDVYSWNGNTYITSGVYTSNFQTSNGCDSTVTLNLTVNSSTTNSITIFACDSYYWNNQELTQSGDYNAVFQTSNGCDSAVSLSLTIGTTSAPFTQGFDIDFPNCWSQPDSTNGEDTLDWTRNSFATPSPGTGPSDDVIGGGHYMYIESSLPAQHGDNAIMYSNLIDISSLTYPELRFFSHMYGEAIGSLTIEIQGENDTVPTSIFSKSGDQGDLWVQERVTFTSTSNLVRFKITGVLDSNALGAVWAGDMAIDEFGVREAVPNDLAIIAANVNSDCELTATEPIELWVVNNGLVDQAGFKLSYSINGGAPVLDSISQLLNIGDTLKHIFNATADMSTDGIYDIDFACILAVDADVTDNVLNFVAENYTTPVDAITLDDTICFVGDVGQISAISDGWIYWYDSLVGGSLVGENDTLYVTPSATTSYFAEVSDYDSFEEDFESYNPGDLIAQSSNDWNTWSDPNGGADDDAEVTDFVSAGGSNSLYLSDDYGDDIVLPLGNTYSTGVFNFETDMYIETEAYLNFQEGAVNGEAWAFDLYFNDTVINVEIDDSIVLTVAYNPNNPLGAPVWFNFSLKADLNNGQWKMFKDGVSIGSFSMNDEISSVNFWASTGNDYYIDNVQWSAWGGDACRSLSRTEAVVVLDSCNTTTVNEVSFENLKIYPNPNNGSFTIANSELINGVVIMDLQGKVVYRNSNLNLYNLNVNLENLDRGMYMINIISENEIITKTIIVN